MAPVAAQTLSPAWRTSCDAPATGRAPRPPVREGIMAIRLGRLLAASALVVTFGLSLGRAAAAQTPAASSVGPVACAVAPRPIDQLVALWFAASGTPIATPLPSSPVAGIAHL